MKVTHCAPKFKGTKTGKNMDAAIRIKSLIPKAVATGTKNPARVIGLNDRGELAPGLRANLIRVRMSGDMPIVRGAWHKGERAF